MPLYPPAPLDHTHAASGIGSTGGGADLDPATVDATGAVSVGGLLTVTGGQIAFPATQSASADANTLDDYEEGSWTPAMSFGGGTTGITYSTQQGSYTKIGRLVFVRGRVILSDNGTSTGAALITGLPFATLAAPPPSFSVGQYANMAAGVTVLYARVTIAAGTTITLNKNGAGSTAAVTDADTTNTTDIFVSGVYEV